ncbi:DUF308 domain-containing protein [Arthrobacter gengyunqii]|uniref:DUF308 domain-containing protein n=1 Tax=Arthrobacter gengyunqii TaxID=2886940 RepID=A0ABS8GK24_9MICC|nr:DUF308 domain-containing protein [Arthrobacter gengyunqii]MCC3266929.1 DUF308 domain-containing protein [Arthrobacter gengyunqii]
MTTPELPGGGSHTIPPHQPQQPTSTDHGYGVSTATLSPEPKKQKKQSNIVGLIALIAAVLGFIFACMPGALIVGWILLPIAFILGLVSLFIKNKSKWMGITALILSIVGTIVGVIVFFSVVTDSVDEALSGGETSVVEPSDGAAPQGNAEEEREADGEAGTRANPYSIGSVIENDEWRVVVNSVDLAATDAVLAANEYNEAPAEGSEYILVNYSATFLGDDPNGQMPAMLSIEYVTADGTTVNSYDSMVMAPEPIDSTSALYTDGTATGNVVFSVPTATAGQGALAIRPGIIGDKVFVAVQ